MDTALEDYRNVAGTLPGQHRVWRLTGPGLSDLDPPGTEPLPVPGPDELLVRHDAVGICFSDVKVARLGLDHPRIRRYPIVPGHEVTLTVAAVGPALSDAYAPGDRFIVQADTVIDGVARAYGHDLTGGLAQYAVLAPEVLPYLVPVRGGTGYAEAALAEPWACVEAAYSASYRTTWRAGGTVWLTGDGAGVTLGAAADWRPRLVHLDVRDERFADLVGVWAAEAGVEVTAGPPDSAVDDVAVLGPEPELVERALAVLAPGGTCALVTAEPLPRRVQVDVGRLHYDGLALLGTDGDDLATAYAPIRTDLAPAGRLWVLGAGGPLGRMHVQRGLERADGPAAIVATDRSGRAATTFGDSPPAALTFLAERDDPAALAKRLRTVTGGRGFDDIAVMAPSVRAIESAFDQLADGGVINLFAGLPRGTMCAWEVSAIAQRGVRVVGTSGSSVAHLRRVRDRIESGELHPNRSVSAVGGLDAAPDALHAVAEGRFAGKVVIFPNLRGPLPLTTLPELAAAFPEVARQLDNGQWTLAAERELLRGLL